MKGRILYFILIVFEMSSGMLLFTANAASWPNLPLVPITMKLMNGTSSYYVATLSNVTAGYDVANGVYSNWCVDRRYAPLVGTYDVLLYSSLNPPVSLQSQRWDMVNYILNHKQGSMMDVQRALWYFIDMIDGVGWWNGSAPSATSLAIVNDALTSGGGYVPGQGELLAVICCPSATQTQISLIEIRIPPQAPTAPVGGYTYSIGVSKKADGQVTPYLASMIILTAFLVMLGRKTETKAREHRPKS